MISAYLTDAAQLERLFRLRDELALKAQMRRERAVRVRNSDNTADGERIAEATEKLAAEADADAELIGKLIHEMRED